MEHDRVWWVVERGERCARPRMRKNGMCSTHYARLLRHGNPFTSLNPHWFTDAERFWPKVDKNGPVPECRLDLGPCWLWTGITQNQGYGKFARRLETESRRKYVLAHRTAYELEVGPIPGGLVLDHLCCNRICVNPGHLEPVTQAENARRAAEGRPRKTHCDQGHEFTPENTILRRDGSRGCRTCKNENARKRRAIRKSQDSNERIEV